MAELQMKTINTLNEKGFRYKAEAIDGGLAFKFGMMLEGDKKVGIIQPNETEIVVQGLGESKVFDAESFEGFIDKVLNVKAKQEEMNRLEKEILA